MNVQTIVVEICAPKVPSGIAREASRKLPERFEPAIIPVADGKNTPTKTIKEVVVSAKT